MEQYHILAGSRGAMAVMFFALGLTAFYYIASRRDMLSAATTTTLAGVVLMCIAGLILSGIDALGFLNATSPSTLLDWKNEWGAIAILADLVMILGVVMVMRQVWQHLFESTRWYLVGAGFAGLFFITFLAMALVF